MNVITLRDYAKQNNVSYEAVRKQVVRYAGDLGEHIIKDGRQQFLDEEAVAFLDAKRQKNPVAIIQMDKDEQIEALRQEKENLLIKIAAQADKIAEQAAELRETDKALAKVDQLLLSSKEDKDKIEAQKAQINDLSADNSKKDELLAEMAEELKGASEDLEETDRKLTEVEQAAAKKDEELAAARAEIEQLRNRKWYQLLFKKNKE